MKLTQNVKLTKKLMYFVGFFLFWSMVLISFRKIWHVYLDILETILLPSLNIFEPEQRDNLLRYQYDCLAFLILESLKKVYSNDLPHDRKVLRERKNTRVDDYDQNGKTLRFVESLLRTEKKLKTCFFWINVGYNNK